ncbi:hypothetical protein C6P40_003349 [Pichia californica]|uniref:Uncharacterized protein n=1 Tax=Pichia californica TaxID=460514 RepID=A0A9P6WGL0_9ASCO|nr:hypothetical protein C6P42_002589 [[Candida] californica]KAG0686805.1 hypothetical protein C6P40_003349 [[Candida] californica]
MFENVCNLFQLSASVFRASASFKFQVSALSASDRWPLPAALAVLRSPFSVNWILDFGFWILNWRNVAPSPAVTAMELSHLLPAVAQQL